MARYWFASGCPLCGSIGRITTSGAMSSFNLGLANFSFIDPTELTPGPDGALWFPIHGADQISLASLNGIGRITTSGVVSTFLLPTLPDNATAGALTVGSDGALWFPIDTSAFGSTFGAVGRITTSGTITVFPTPGHFPRDQMILGPDGAIWFPDAPLSVGRITTTGAVTFFPTVGAFAHELTIGPDGALWFTANRSDLTSGGNAGAIGRITTNGSFSQFDDPRLVDTAGIFTGPDGAIWFGTNSTSQTPFVGRISAIGSLPSITTAGLPAATLHSPYSASLTAVGGTVPYQWKKIDKLPKGLRLKAKTGVVSGIPKKTGTFTFTVQLKDRSKPKLVAKKTFSITVT